MNTIIDQPSVAILIDCWNTPALNLCRMYSNIMQFINNTPAIETVVLSTYNAQPESDDSKTIWYENYSKLFNQRIPEFQLNTFPVETTVPVILNYVNDNKFQIALRHEWELKCYLTLNPHVKNVYVFGSAWDVCVKIRPLGYESLSKITDLNVLTDTDCVLDYNGNCPVLELPWTHIKDSIYYLNNRIAV